jgi:hypothetical protein
MLEFMDSICGRLHFPQSSVQFRYFGGEKKVAEGMDEYLNEGGGVLYDTYVEQGRVASFIVKILFRQNASWQGTMRAVDGEEEKKFLSALEMARLMDMEMAHV